MTYYTTNNRCVARTRYDGFRCNASVLDPTDHFCYLHRKVADGYIVDYCAPNPNKDDGEKYSMVSLRNRVR